MTDLILASQSSSRRAMLDAAGVTYRAIPAHVDETSVKNALLAQGQPPRNLADALAEMKAIKISQSHPGELVIGSDSIVSIDDVCFDKPADRDQAAAHLAAFSGKTMVLTSAVVVAEGGRPLWRHVEQARLSVRPLSPAFITAYLDAEWPAIGHCVGCFRMEAMGVQLFSAIKGDHFTILGMPLLPLLGFLRQRSALLS